jgi:hypothetical protein
MNAASNQSQREDREIVESLVDLGAVWARYGLRVAQASLNASSQTLSTTARALGTLADAFHRDREEARNEPIVTDAEEAKEG